MPNHLHGIIWISDLPQGEALAERVIVTPALNKADASPLQNSIGTKRGSLAAIIQNFKSVSTRKINQCLHITRRGEAFDKLVPGIAGSRLSNASPLKIWQRNYFERVIRNEKELDRIREYIIGNPRKWAEDEEYQV